MRRQLPQVAWSFGRLADLDSGFHWISWRTGRWSEQARGFRMEIGRYGCSYFRKSQEVLCRRLGPVIRWGFALLRIMANAAPDRYILCQRFPVLNRGLLLAKRSLSISNEQSVWIRLAGSCMGRRLIMSRPWTIGYPMQLAVYDYDFLQALLGNGWCANWHILWIRWRSCRKVAITRNYQIWV